MNFFKKLKQKTADCGKKVKQAPKNYGNAVKKAYEDGYNAGWSDCREKAPFGTAVSGAVGYGAGYRAKRKYNKAQRSEAYVKRIRARAR